MLKIWAVVSVLAVLACSISPAKTQKDSAKDSDRSHLNELEGSGYPGPSLYPDQMEDHGSGWASGDNTDSGEDDDLDDDEDEEELDNHIDESVPVEESPVQSNEVLLNKNAPSHNNIDNRIAMASTNNNSSVFASTEMLAAMIAGGTIGLLFAILLILLLVYRMRKKDEGSYDLSKKPIYKKAPTTEFYA